MSSALTVAKRELSGYFSTPIAYVFIVVFLVLAGILTFYVGGLLDGRQATLQPFFSFHPWLYMFLVPAVAMRVWAEERKSGTLELLMTLPLSTAAAVVGKFLAAWAFVAVALVLTFPLWITVNLLGDPDNGVIVVGYLASLLMAGAFLAIGCCMSALTRNQVIAFVLAATTCFLFTLTGLDFINAVLSVWAPPALIDVIGSLSFLSNFRDITRGVVGLNNVIFFVSMIVFWLFATIVVLDAERGE